MHESCGDWPRARPSCRTFGTAAIRLALRLAVAAALVAATGRSVAAGAEESRNATSAAIRTARIQLQRRLPAQRIEAVKRLRALPPLEAVKLIVPSVVADRDEQVRRAAYEALLAWKDDPQVCDFLLGALEQESRDRKAGVVALSPLIAVLLASELPASQAGLNKSLEAALARSKDSAGALVAVADELGRQDDEQALRSLENLAGLDCFAQLFACRRATVQAMIRVRRPEAVEALLTLLPGVDGEVQGDIVRHLMQISGQRLGEDAAAWQDWWKKHKDGFQFPAAGNRGVLAELAQPGGASYYGLSLTARRVVFILDISGSMEGLRLQAAAQELTRAIEGLAEEVSFSIVVFNSQVAVWQRYLMPANPSMKRAAALFVGTRRAQGDTAAFDALDAAFRFDAEAIYFLTDGKPNAGKIVAPGAIVAAVTQANRSRRISIYTIGIAPGPPEGPFDLFLRTLAEQNSGAYRRVD